MMASVVKPLNSRVHILSRAAGCAMNRNYTTVLPFSIKGPADDKKSRSELGTNIVQELQQQLPDMPMELAQQLEQVVDLAATPQEKITLPLDDLPRCVEAVENYRLHLEKNPTDAEKLVDTGLFTELINLLKWDDLPKLRLDVAWILAKLAGDMSTAQMQVHAISIEENVVPVFVDVLNSHSDELVCAQIIHAFGSLFDFPALQNCIIRGEPLKSMVVFACRTAENEDRQRFSRSIVTVVFSILLRSSDSELVAEVLRGLETLLNPAVSRSLVELLSHPLHEMAAYEVVDKIVNAVQPRQLAYSVRMAIVELEYQR